MVAKKGPPSSLETGKAGVRADQDASPKAQSYSVQLHTMENGLEIKYVTAESGDEAAAKVLAGCNYKDASIRGVTPASDPDANSMGGERDAAQMIANAENGGHIVNSLGTEKNAETVEKLGHADIDELKA